MLDLKLIRENPNFVKEGAKNKGIFDLDSEIEKILKLDLRRRELIQQCDELKTLRNKSSEEISQEKKKGVILNDIPGVLINIPEAEEVSLQSKKISLKEISLKIKEYDERISAVESEMNSLLLIIPNIADAGVPKGRNEGENVVVRDWGQKPEFDFTPLPHWDIGEALGILDAKTAAKISGSRFTVLWGSASRMVRAIISFMLDVHTKEHGYTEVYTPFLVNPTSMTGTGQLPKFEEDLFKCSPGNYYLIPTAEVPVTNIHRDEILSEDDLPIKYVAYTACFRSEAGTYGKDTRGMVRQHQFDKVELVKFVKPENSLEELELLLNDAESILQKLNIHYRITMMCTGDLGFTAAKKYDIEVWCPGQNKYLEISSCSSFTDFQARRANIKYRLQKEKGGGTGFVHTLNGSGLAVGRTLIAVMENYQNKDGTITVPDVLRKYFGEDLIKGR